MSVKELQKAVHATAVCSGWWENVDPVAHFPVAIALIHSELSEALEEYRAGHDVTKVYVEDGKPEGVGIELADAVIRILDYCEAAGIDLDAAIELKADYNRGRGHRHGGKVV